MKIHSTFIYLGLSVATVLPALGHAQQGTLPAWLHPMWIKAKFTDSPVKNSDRIEMAQANVVTNNGTANPQSIPQMKPPINNAQINSQMNPQMNPQTLQLQFRQAVSLAPVETAVPKINEKHLTAEELKELRKQLRQQR